MLLKMKKTTQGSPNGIAVISYIAGEKYDIVEGLAKVFLNMDIAEMVTEKENKDAGGAPSNKDAGGDKKDKKDKKDK